MSAQKPAKTPAKTSAWKIVARMEWRILRRDRAAVVMLGLFAVLLLIAAYVGGQRAQAVADNIGRAHGEDSARKTQVAASLKALTANGAPLSGQDPRDPAWMGREGAAPLVSLPPAPLAAIAVGERDLHPQILRVTTSAHLTAERATESPMSGPTRMTTGAFDPTFLFVVLFPLVIIALSYELLSGERERGTLAMLLSQPVSQRALVFGKAGARLILLWGVTALFAIGGLVVAGADIGSGGLEVVLYAGVLLAWALFWFAASVAVNALGKGSATNALLLFGLWLAVVVVVPGLVRVGVDTAYPPPSRLELLHEAREAAQVMERELAGLEGRHDQDTKTKDYAKRLAQVQTELAKRSAPVVNAHRAQLEQRQGLLDGLRFASPALVVQRALEDIAGTGAQRHHRFQVQVDAFHTQFRKALLEKAGEQLKPSDLASLSQWHFEEAPTGALIQSVLAGIAGLLFGAFLLFALAMPGLRRVGRLTG